MAEKYSDRRSPKGQKIGAFGFGVLIALLPIAVGVLLNPSSAGEFTGGRYELVIIALTIGLTLGHYIGLALISPSHQDVYAAIGAFLTVAIAFTSISFLGAGWSDTVRSVAVVLIAMFALILGYYTRVITNKEWGSCLDAHE